MVPLWVLETEAGPSARAASALNPEPRFLPKIFCFCEIIPHEKEKERNFEGRITKSKKAAQREVIKVHGGNARGPGG